MQFKKIGGSETKLSVYLNPSAESQTWHYALEADMYLIQSNRLLSVSRRILELGSLNRRTRDTGPRGSRED